MQTIVHSPPSRWRPHLKVAVIAGRRLHYMDTGEGPAVLLIHGIGCSWTHWAANLDALAADHRVIVVDVPGFGASEPAPSRSELMVSAEALVELMDQRGIDRFAVVGHSLGGLVAWLIATIAPDRVTRLGLVDSATVALSAVQINAIVRSFSLGSRVLARPGVARAVLRRPRLRRMVMALLMARRDGVTPEWAVELLTPLTVAPGFADALWAAPRALLHVKPADMNVPTLIVWGTKDPIFPVRAARRLAAEMPNASLTEIPRARHWPMFEQPRVFNAVLREFLARG